MFGLFLLSAIVGAASYGVYVDQARNDPARVIGAACATIVSQSAVAGPAAMRGHCTEWLAFQGNLFTFSVWMAVVVGGMGTLTEWIRTRRQP